ncbi:uncharacterized protein [Antedon mediterranea]|uniref:uncharacterized protein n=1 Tax=Antedon mediterranea TaxID=105859 RepID=UPI003AF9D665
MSTRENSQENGPWIDVMKAKYGNQPLYAGSQISTVDSLSLLMAYCLEHNATERNISNILDIIQLHLPKESTIPKHLRSYYYLKQDYDIGKKETINKHPICSHCGYLSEDGMDATSCSMCKRLGTFTNESYFITLDIKSQLEELFKDPAVVKGLSVNKTSEDGVIRDIYDGEIYKRRNTSTDTLLLTLTWHFDGVSVSKSSKQSIWPLHAVINELPPKRRFNKNRILMFGLWSGDSKPQMPSFMIPLTPIINDLYNNGISIGGREVKVLFHVGTMDLLAMCLTKNMQQFNGKHGCGMCEVSSVRVPKGKGSVSVYPWIPAKPKLRTANDMMEQAKEAMQTKDCVKGIKGYTMLSKITYIDPATDIVVDYLHGVCSGLMKSMLKVLLFDRSKPCYIGDQMTELDARLCAIKPTDCITRTPRSIGENFADIKG